jgi:hypothetical protein
MPSKRTPVTPATSTGSKSGASAVRTVAPMIPLAIALLHTAVISPSGGRAPAGPPAPTTVEAVKCGEGIEDFHACHASYPTGCTISGSAYDPYLNLMKNQTMWGSMEPQEVFTSLSQVQQLEAKLPVIGINQKNHGEKLSQLKDLGEGSIFGVIGYLYDVVPEGKESSNCQLDKDPPDFGDVDYHIFIGFDPAVAETIRNGKAASSAEKHQAMIVEMTPHYRDAFHQEWTVDALRAVKGQQVKVLGQLMVDNEHYVSGQDCGIDPTKAACWRASVWELHPVTDFRVCGSGDCTTTSTASWAAVGESDSKAASASASPSKRATAGKP